jgi:hypothetical protein
MSVSMTSFFSYKWPTFAAAAVCFSALLVLPEQAQAQFTQEGPKLVGTGGVGGAQQGGAVALSSDGNTAIVGGRGDNSNTGATWVYAQLTKEDCQHGEWLNFPSPPGPFTSQGQCVSLFCETQIEPHDDKTRGVSCSHRLRHSTGS